MSVGARSRGRGCWVYLTRMSNHGIVRGGYSVGAMIHFGTDGWRARVDGDFTDEQVVRIADAAARVWAQAMPGAIVYIGFDTRAGAEHFAVLAGRVLAARGLVAKVSDRPVPTPALSWTVAHDQRACGGLSITGSHNPPDYLGVKLRMAGGGTMSDDMIEAVEDAMSFVATDERGPVQRCDLMTRYLAHLRTTVDAEAIAAAQLSVVYDPLYGAARGFVPALLRDFGVTVTEIHGADDAGMAELHPDPIEPWVDECEGAVVAAGACAGFINDGDADRVGAVDEHGRYVSPQKLLALLAQHLVRNRGMGGRVVINQSTSVMVRRVARDLGCRVVVKPVGFKHIYEEIAKGDVLVGGEEAGGISVPAFCPERDGILVILLICELVAMSGKTLGALVDELEATYGHTSYARRDLRLENEVIEMFRTLLPGLNPAEVAGLAPVNVSHMDGLRLEFADESWLLLRPSGTEPVVRVYAEAPTVELRDELLEAGCDLARGV